MAETAEPTMDASALTPEQLQSKLEHLKASATQQYSLKNYSAAAEFYSEAAEVQDLVNGEMSPENSDLLYQYGRCLYHVGVSKSDVLGGKVASNEEPKRKKRKTAPVAERSSAGAANGDSVIADALKSGEQKLGDVKEEDEDVKEPEAKIDSKNPYFQITGDENWEDDSDEDEEEGEGEDGEEEEEDDDFAIAYEILDVARVLLGRKLESLSDASSPEARQIKERLADTHDLQAEIKLENEQFADAVADAKSALGFKLELFPQESGMIAEAHYKLAIALDFAALPTAPAEEENTADALLQEKGKGKEPEKEKEEPNVNEEMRAEAATEMEKAIASCQLRIQKEEAAGQPAASIADIKSLVADMKNRLVDLRNPAQPLTTAGQMDAPDGADPLRGVLGAMLGASKAEQAKKLQEATSQANDLSGLVKKRKAPKVENGEAGSGKKPKVEEK